VETKLEKKYGLLTAISMVVGIVIGSGVFFKAEKILKTTGGNLWEGILAWIIGGVVMIACAYTFAIMATRYQFVNGIVDYAEATVGRTYGNYVGWFMATIYYPTLTSVLAWVSARYTCVILGWGDRITGAEAMTIACLYLIGSYALNALSPKLAGKFQVSATVIKLIPLVLMAVIGTIVGLINGLTVQNFTQVTTGSAEGLLGAVVATTFAYEGWIIATSINAELRNAKRNLPIALIVGTFIVMLVYILYYIGLAGVVENDVLIEGGESGAKIAFKTLFGSYAGTFLFVFVIISCLGTLNGLMLGCTRGIYSLSVRGFGPKPDMYSQVCPETNMPHNSSILGLLLCGVWFVFFYGANLAPDGGWFGFFNFDSSELPIVATYALYIPILIMFMIKSKDLKVFNRIIMPVVSTLGCLFMIYAAYFAHKKAVWAFLIIFAAFMVVGIGINVFNKLKAKSSK